MQNQSVSPATQRNRFSDEQGRSPLELAFSTTGCPDSLVRRMVAELENIREAARRAQVAGAAGDGASRDLQAQAALVGRAVWVALDVTEKLLGQRDGHHREVVSLDDYIRNSKEY